MSDERVYLKCIKIKSKLRVRITTPGYKNEANCQFPRAIRVEGKKFSVRPQDVILVRRGASYFYSIKTKNLVTLGEDENIPDQSIKNMIKKVYNVEDFSEECVICMDKDKDSVFNPCGHFIGCKTCCQRLDKCPICRINVLSIIDYAELK